MPMQLSLKRLKGLEVYEDGNPEACGKIKNVCFDARCNRVNGVIVETVSLIPLSKTLFMDEFGEICDDRVLLKKDVSLNKVEKRSDKFCIVSDAIQRGGQAKKIRDIKFDFETGEVIDITTETGLLKKKSKIPVNTMLIKDNTIYVE